MTSSIHRGWLSLDLRALAFFRIALALLAFYDLGQALWQVGPFYGDGGILPRAAVSLEPASYVFGLFFASGESWFQAVLMGLGLFCALFVLLGRYSRPMGWLLWYILCCLHIRNHYVCDRGAALLEISLFWGLFLPWEARWSWNSRLHPDWRLLPDTYRSPATVALLLQLALIYVFTTTLKNGIPWVVDGNAVLIACRSNQVSTPYSEWLAHFPHALRVMTPLTLVLEALVAFLLLNPVAHFKSRSLVVMGLVAFHLHNTQVFCLGWFPLMNALVVLVALPSPWWGRAQEPSGEQPEQLPPAYRLARPTQFWLAFCLGFCIYCNIQSSPHPKRIHLVEPLLTFGRVTRLSQSWELFSPGPPTDLWFRLLARDAQGKQVDLWAVGRQVSEQRPAAFMTRMPSHGWQMALLNTVYGDDPELRRGIFSYFSSLYQGTYTVESYQRVLLNYSHDEQPEGAEVRQLWPPAPTAEPNLRILK